MITELDVVAQTMERIALTTILQGRPRAGLNSSPAEVIVVARNSDRAPGTISMNVTMCTVHSQYWYDPVNVMVLRSPATSIGRPSHGAVCFVRDVVYCTIPSAEIIGGFASLVQAAPDARQTKMNLTAVNFMACLSPLFRVW